MCADKGINVHVSIGNTGASFVSRSISGVSQNIRRAIAGDQETATLVMQQPLKEAFKLIRRALPKEGLEIAADLNVAGRIERPSGLIWPLAGSSALTVPWRCW